MGFTVDGGRDSGRPGEVGKGFFQVTGVDILSICN